MNSKIGASLNFNQNISSKLRTFKSLGYDYAELGIGLSFPISLYEKKLKKICNKFIPIFEKLKEIHYSGNLTIEST
jgi:sugar phosphate isomerase/epimerase